MITSVTPIIAFANAAPNGIISAEVMDITESITTGGLTRASWGKVTLSSTKKKASTKVSTFAGTAYFLAAQTSIPATGDYINNDNFNVSSVDSGTLNNPNPKEGITWKGLGVIRDTATSGEQSASTSKSY
ncbi:MAG: hypothetical protein LBQ71_21275 [Hungatella sp.]|jgi:hypothetical protein|nr:hypothetical protein [Hungatella sp.]